MANYFLPATLVSAIDFDHFILILLTLTMAWGHKVSTKQNLLASFSHTLSIWVGWNVVWWWSNSNWTSCDWLLLSEVIESRELSAVLLTASTSQCWHAFGHLVTDFLQTWYGYGCYWTLHFDTSLCGFDHESRSQGCKKAKPSMPSISQSYSTEVEYGVLLRLMVW